MTTLRNRAWGVSVGQPGGLGTLYEFGRMRFSSRMKGGSGSWSARLAYSNPSRGMLGQLGEEGAVVRILAGYESTGAVEVARGTVVAGSMSYRRVGDPRVELELHAARATLATLVSGTLDGSGTAADVVDLIRRELGLAAGFISERLSDVSFARGYVYLGSPRTILSELCTSAGCVFDVDDGRLVVREVGAAKGAATADVWASDTGLLDVTAPGGRSEVRAKALLRASMRPGDVVRLDSEDHQGDIVVREVVHDGDTHGDVWTTTVVGVPRG